MELDLSKLNSATKYPSIETYHKLGERGALTEELSFDFASHYEEAILTEKVDCTNGRIVVTPDGDYFIGSREELLYAKGDRIENPALNIVPTLKPIAERIVANGSCLPFQGFILSYFFEVYGGNVGANAKQYTADKATLGARLFDVASVDEDVLNDSLEQISSWREKGGQKWADEFELEDFSEATEVPLTPRLGQMKGSALPVLIQNTAEWLSFCLPSTKVALDDSGFGRPEGIVIRTASRSLIAKARFQDYERTLKRRQGGKK